MYFKQWDIPIRSLDGTVSSELSYIIPVLNSDEATQLLSDTNEWRGEILIDGPNDSVTESGRLILDTYGVSSVVLPFTHSQMSDYNTVWEDVVRSHMPGLTDVTDLMLSMPITGSNNKYTFRKFYATIDGVDYSMNNSYMWSAISNAYRPMGVNQASSASTSTDYFWTTYGSGTGSNDVSDTYWKMDLFWLVDGVDSYIISLRLTGYYSLTPSTLKAYSAFKMSSSSDYFNLVKLWFLDNSTGKKADPLINTDPYANGGSTDSGGGTGDFDGSSDAIGIPDLPSASATDAGFITLFNPTLSQMQSLASYMWSDLFDLDAWRKIFADPMDAILGLSIVPVKVGSSGTREVKVGNISTGVTMDVASSQYVKVDCGTLNVKEYWGAYLDYEPFTKAEIYLPYIGTHPIAVDDIMGKAVHVEYHVDILSGACVAYVQCTGGKLDSVLYNFVGQCSSSIPITGNDWTNVVNGVLSIAGSIGTMVATGGAAAPFAVGEIANSAVNSMKPTVEKSGSVSGTGGLMGIQKPYLILTRPRQAVPKNQYKYTGYPAYINRKLSDLKGYTEVDQIHIEGVYATEQEYSELDSLIRSGVIF